MKKIPFPDRNDEGQGGGGSTILVLLVVVVVLIAVAIMIANAYAHPQETSPTPSSSPVPTLQASEIPQSHASQPLSDWVTLDSFEKVDQYLRAKFVMDDIRFRMGAQSLGRYQQQIYEMRAKIENLETRVAALEAK